MLRGRPQEIVVMSGGNGTGRQVAKGLSVVLPIPTVDHRGFNLLV